ncbi:MAG: hypothetical protein HFH41_01490 [Lachnospiraceae bacterium]|nr:hypothetical protein [Lachnospiraceae bacterium]
MKKRQGIAVGLLCSLLLNPMVPLAAEPAMEPEQAEETKEGEHAKEVITTKLEADGREVTLTLKLKADSQVTSGRVGVYYDKTLLELSETDTGDFWQTEDINKEVEIKGKQGLSYAWADTDKLTEEQELLTLSFQALEEADGKEVSVETEILELFSGNAPIAAKWKSKTDKVQIDQNQESQNQENQNQETPGQDGKEKRSSSGVKTGDQTNAAGYILLAFGAVMVILDAGKKIRS